MRRPGLGGIGLEAWKKTDSPKDLHGIDPLHGKSRNHHGGKLGSGFSTKNPTTSHKIRLGAEPVFLLAPTPAAGASCTNWKWASSAPRCSWWRPRACDTWGAAGSPASTAPAHWFRRSANLLGPAPTCSDPFGGVALLTLFCPSTHQNPGT